MHEHILVVDDEPGIRESFRMMLQDKYDVYTAKGGRECLELVREDKKLSLIILDLRMPDIDGRDVLKEIKKIAPSLPVVILTAIGTHQTVIETLKLGAADFIAKPVDVQRVREIIGRILTESKEATEEEKYPERISSVERILNDSFSETIEVLTEIIAIKGSYFKRHSKWTAMYAVAIAERLGFSKEQIEVILHTSLLHNIGKVGISDSILHKNDKLTPAEWKEMKKHPLIAERILKHFKLMRIEQTMIRHHCERYDGKGYPRGLKGEEIPIYARILAVANAFAAMTSDRLYKKTLPQEEAVRELKRGRGSQFDPKIVDVFIEMLQD